MALNIGIQGDKDYNHEFQLVYNFINDMTRGVYVRRFSVYNILAYTNMLKYWTYERRNDF